MKHKGSLLAAFFYCHDILKNKMSTKRKPFLSISRIDESSTP